MSAEVAERLGGARGSTASRAFGCAFGLDLEGSFTAPGLLEGHRGAGVRRAVIELVSATEFDAGWRADGAVRLHETYRASRLVLAIDSHDELGYRLVAPDYGRYLISRNGRGIRCADVVEPDWHWQSFLTGQVLPAAAVLQGLEALHASAVAMDERAVAMTGPSGAGKSSLAVNLVCRGAAFLADDVVALEPRGEEVLAHPGAGLASVRHQEARSIGAAAMALLGRTLGRDEHEVRVVVEREQRPLPLAAVYQIEREGEASKVAFEQLKDPRVLLGSTFSRFVATRERLVNQLDVCSAVDRAARVFRVRVPPDVGAGSLAASLEVHALHLAEGRVAW